MSSTSTAASAMPGAGSLVPVVGAGAMAAIRSTSSYSSTSLPSGASAAATAVAKMNKELALMESGKSVAKMQEEAQPKSEAKGQEVDIFNSHLVPLHKRKKMVELDEDVYVQALEQIIERDFFPDLPKLRAQYEYLQALEDNDLAKLQEISRKYNTPRPLHHQTPASFETPLPGSATPSVFGGEAASVGAGAGVGVGSGAAAASEPHGSAPATNDPSQPNTNLSLDDFVATYTSEDNASFDAIIGKARDRTRKRYKWMYEQVEKERAMRGGAIAAKAKDEGRSYAIDSWHYTPKNALVYVPDGIQVSAAEMIEESKRKKQVLHSNTRLPASMLGGSTFRSTLTAASSGSAPGLGSAAPGAVGGVGGLGDSPRVNGYGFVVTPSPAPGENVDSLMTWGTIGGAPFRLDGGDEQTQSKPVFKIPDPSPRDALGTKLAADVRRKNRKAAAAVAGDGSSSAGGRSGNMTPVDRLRALSPAAQKLGKGLAGFATGISSLRASYSTPVAASRNATPVASSRGTPTPLSRASPAPAKVAAGVSVGAHAGGVSRPSSALGAGAASITDNLLS